MNDLSVKLHVEGINVVLVLNNEDVGYSNLETQATWLVWRISLDKVDVDQCPHDQNWLTHLDIKVGTFGSVTNHSATSSVMDLLQHSVHCLTCKC